MEEQQPTPQPVKSKKKFYRKWWFFLAAIIIGVVVGLIAIEIDDYYKKHISTDIKAQADDYIISMVGRDYFEENYSYYEPGSSKCVREKNNQVYCVRYHYLPASRISGEDTLVHVTVRTSSGSIGGMNIYNCLENKKLCELSVGKDEALQKASENGFNIQDENFTIVFGHSPNNYVDPLNAEYETGWTWNIYEYPQPYHGCQKMMTIDVITGATYSDEVCLYVG